MTGWSARPRRRGWLAGPVCRLRRSSARASRGASAACGTRGDRLLRSHSRSKSAVAVVRPGRRRGGRRHPRVPARACSRTTRSCDPLAHAHRYRRAGRQRLARGDGCADRGLRDRRGPLLSRSARPICAICAIGCSMLLLRRHDAIHSRRCRSCWRKTSRLRAFSLRIGAGGGLVLQNGGTTGHVAILARSRGVPMLVGVDLSRVERLRRSAARRSRRVAGVAIPMRRRGRNSTGGAQHHAAQARADRCICTLKPAWPSGERVRVMINVAHPEELRRYRPAARGRHRAGAHRVPVPRARTPARRRGAVPRLSPHREVGGWPAGHHPHPRCRRRQADRRV